MDRLEISTSGKWRYQPQSFRGEQKNLVNFGPLTPVITWLLFTYPKSTVRVLRMLMHLISIETVYLSDGCCISSDDIVT